MTKNYPFTPCKPLWSLLVKNVFLLISYYPSNTDNVSLLSLIAANYP